MRSVNLGNAPQPAANDSFGAWVLAALKQVEAASNDTLQNDASSSGAAMATVHGAAADEIVYYTDETHTDFTALTAFARTVIAAANAAALLTVIGGVPASRQIVSGGGLTGGGDLSADRTLAVGAGTGITVNPDDVALTVPVAVVNGGTGGTTQATARAGIAAAATAQTDFISGIIKAAANQDYRIVEKIPYGATLTAFTGKTASGTLTATLKINTTAVTTGAINVTSTQGSVSPSAANIMVSGDALVITISAISAPVDFSFTIAFTRTLA